MIALRYLLLLGCAFQASLCLTAEDVDFNRDIKSVLSNRCFACHGPDPEQREAGLRLDTQEGAFEDLGGYSAVTPGSLEKSELWARIQSDDPDAVMPPPSMGDPLSPAERAAFKRWIEGGAVYAPHWSYIPPQAPQPPINLQTDLADHWAQTPVDAFILKRLQEAKLPPSPPASDAFLLRRLSLDLTGLPPTPEEADRFESDTAPDKVERMVDRLLSQPAAGERWAAVWLDLARYADSAGYADDPPRTIWPYRDYVIESFAGSKPFDQFTVEQIAGDLLPPETNVPVAATGFHRNTMTNSEGGTDDEEFRSAAIVDRVNTTFAVWMGSTMACAQCHTHKYDPFTHEEYFQVYAILNSTADADRRDESPTQPFFTASQQIQKSVLSAQLRPIETRLSAEKIPTSPQQTKWEQSIGTQQPQGRYVRIDLPGENRFLSLAEVEVWQAGQNIAPTGKAQQSSTGYGGEAKRAIDGNRDGNYDNNSVTHNNQEKSPWWELDLGSPQAVEAIEIWNRTGPGMRERLDGFRISLLDADKKVVFSETVKKAPAEQQRFEITSLPAELAAIVAIPADQRNADQQNRLGRVFWQRQLEAIQQQIADITPMATVPVLQELPQPRSTNIHLRGSYLSLGKAVQPGVPAVFHDLPDERVADRLGLAEWLVDRQNPLTARVMVNRVWEQFFGIGLVATSEEFGSQGELPSHPELLDWLAVEWMESDWDLQHLIRQIVLSATYQQSSDVSQLSLERDPTNRLLSRGPRFRLSAEAVRDQALAVSGLLSRTMFGPSVQPPRPTLGLKAAFGGSTDWKDSVGGDRYRRALYTEWRRSMPYPSMATFDAPSREVCILNRGTTNTPLQALVTMNDPVYIEASQGLARMTWQAADSHDDRLNWLFRRCLIRAPSDDEVAALDKLYKETAEWYASRETEANAMATNPLGPIPANVSATSSELAAWTVLANVMLNLDETLQKR